MAQAYPARKKNKPAKGPVYFGIVLTTPIPKGAKPPFGTNPARWPGLSH